MKTKRKLVMFGLGMMILCGSMTTTFAAFVYGTSYQTVTHKDIPSFGGVHFDTNYGSKKATTGGFATFSKVRGDALLGNFGALINSSKTIKSEFIGLKQDKPSLASEISCTKGTIYYSVAKSSGVEPSNTCDVTINFSADNLK